jgi:hypothetical protein
MTKEEALQRVEKEFTTARHAHTIGNDGMVRVCARRAVGIAITYWLQSHARSGWGVDAMNQLRALALDDSLPQNVRSAAARLTTKITERFASPHSTDPIDDAHLIINYLVEKK